jgi:hypothetical protein
MTFYCLSASRRTLAAVILLLSCWRGADAAELGEASVRSHIGRPLVADIELTGLADENAHVQVALASADVYRGASIRMNPALADLNITINRRDGHRNIHLISARPIEADYLHLFLELTEGNRRVVRAVTLWLTADPEAGSVSALSASLTTPATVVATPAAPLSGSAGATLAAAQLGTSAAAQPAPLPAFQPAQAAAPVSAPAPSAQSNPPSRPARSHASAPGFTAEQLRACTELDYKNAALRAQIVDLEEKVKLLQMAFEGGAVQAAAQAPNALSKHTAPAQAASTVASSHAALASSTDAAPHALDEHGASLSGVAKPAAGRPWRKLALASVLVLALIGGLVYFFIRRRRKAAERTENTQQAAATGAVAGWKSRALSMLRIGKTTPAGVVVPEE